MSDRNLLIQSKLVRFSSYLANFNIILAKKKKKKKKKMSKTLTISPENNPCIGVATCCDEGSFEFFKSHYLF